MRSFVILFYKKIGYGIGLLGWGIGVFFVLPAQYAFATVSFVWGGMAYDNLVYKKETSARFMPSNLAHYCIPVARLRIAKLIENNPVGYNC
jgi:hypothetical protein